MFQKSNQSEHLNNYNQSTFNCISEKFKTELLLTYDEGDDSNHQLQAIESRRVW